jgi:hypothetical protein
MICSGRSPSVSVVRRRQLTYRPTWAVGVGSAPAATAARRSARSSSNIGLWTACGIAVDADLTLACCTAASNTAATASDQSSRLGWPAQAPRLDARGPVSTRAGGSSALPGRWCRSLSRR